MNDFTTLGLSAPILRALADENYTVPTPIQAKAIPPLLAGSDLLGIAQTGTGKTAAFALPALNHLAANRVPAVRRSARVLVLSPTRELSQQIADSFRTYGRHLKTTVAVVVGGTSMRAQIRALERGVDVVVATPGRLLDHVAERTIDLSRTEILVLDEADQMLDLGFIKPIRRIVSSLPAKRQNLLFSATMPGELSTLAAEMMRSPVKIAVTPVASTVDRIAQKVVVVDRAGKKSALAKLLGEPGVSRALVFTRTKRGADAVATSLDAAGIDAVALHGNKSQSQRERALLAFRDGKVRVLVATDIASRGIDVDGISHVVNFELPEVPEAYVHRIGRTARAGSSGIAISLVDPSEAHLLRAIEKLTRKTIDREDVRGSRVAAPVAGEGHRGTGTEAPHRQARGERPEPRGRGRGHRGRNGGQNGHGGHAGHGSHGGRGGQYAPRSASAGDHPARGIARARTERHKPGHSAG